MSVARKDDRHNEDLAREIADSFNQTMRAKDSDDDADTGSDAAEPPAGGQRFVITGDQRQTSRKRRSH